MASDRPFSCKLKRYVRCIVAGIINIIFGLDQSHGQGYRWLNNNQTKILIFWPFLKQPISFHKMKYPLMFVNIVNIRYVKGTVAMSPILTPASFPKLLDPPLTCAIASKT